MNTGEAKIGDMRRNPGSSRDSMWSSTATEAGKLKYYSDTKTLNLINY